MSTKEPKNLVRFTTDDAEAIIGRKLTEEEYYLIVGALPDSTMGDAFAEAVASICGKHQYSATIYIAGKDDNDAREILEAVKIALDPFIFRGDVDVDDLSLKEFYQS
jgi:hypothetical protein